MEMKVGWFPMLRLSVEECFKALLINTADLMDYDDNKN
jgi:hypothetical protein